MYCCGVKVHRLPIKVGTMEKNAKYEQVGKAI